MTENSRLLKAMLKMHRETFSIYKTYTSNNVATRETESLGLPSVNDYEKLSEVEIARIMVDRAKEILLTESGLE